MEINWPVLIITGVALVSLLLFLVNRNRRDKKILERKLNEDYKKSKDEEGDIEIEDTKSV
jgi:low affinity Fe/Cu permease